MKTSERLYQKTEKIWAGYHRHPFVQGLGNGTLSIEKFRHYMLQDYLYLFEYAKVFALGVVKADEHMLMQRFSKGVYSILNSEMNIHRAYLSRLGIMEKEIQSTQMEKANSVYTQYMLSAGERGGVCEILSAILSCSWSYAEIGLQLSLIPKAAEHPFFGEWIRGYSSEDYQKGNQEWIDLFDEKTKNCSKKQLLQLEEIFVQCSVYEADFWDMAWEEKKERERTGSI